jgi:predicted ATPase/class 3 adenylate cyclase
MSARINDASRCARRRLPSGTVTFLFTDIEGSTRLVRAHPDAYPVLLQRHRDLVRASCREGAEFGTEGDALFFAFDQAGEAVTAAAEAERRLLDEPWPEGAAIRVRIGVSTGVGQLLGENYVGIEPHRTARICAAAHGGQVLASEETVALCRPLPDGISFYPVGRHVLKDFDEPMELSQVVSGGVREAFPPPRTALARIVRLPRTSAGLIGRDQELAEVQKLVLSERLVTLTGPGGSGKTRLAVAVANNAAPLFRGHVAFVPVAHVTQSADITRSFSHALGWEGLIETWEDILAAFRDQNGLLIFDNLEHLLPEAGGLVDQLLETCPRVHVIATTRIPTQVVGEQLYPVKPLRQPDAVALLVQRARRDRPDYAPATPDEAHALEAIAARLDGLPLALELAGARLRVLPASALYQRIERRQPVLESQDSSLPERVRTMHGAIQWSYDLLTPDDQALLGALSVFPTAAPLEAVAAVASTNEIDALGGLERLIGASVAELVDVDGPRYTMLEPIRQFANDRLTESGRAHEMRDGMFEWYADAATPLSPYAGDVLPILYHDRDNARRALEHAADAGKWSRAIDLCFKLMTVLFQTGATATASAWRIRAEAHWDELDSVDRAKLALMRAGAAPEIDDQIAALRIAIHYARAAGETQLVNVGILRLAQRELGAGFTPTHVEATLGGIVDPDPTLRIFLAGSVALIAGIRGDPRADCLWVESVALARTSALPYTASEVLNNVAWAAVVKGEGDLARRLSEEAIALDMQHAAAHQWHLPKSLFDTRHTAALAAVLTGDVEAAATHFTAVLATVNQLGASERVFTVARIVHGVCGLLAAAGRYDAAIRLLGFAEPRIEDRYVEVDAHASYVHLLNHAREVVRERVAALQADGKLMSDQEALEFALNEVQDANRSLAARSH